MANIAIVPECLSMLLFPGMDVSVDGAEWCERGLLLNIRGGCVPDVDDVLAVYHEDEKRIEFKDVA